MKVTVTARDIRLGKPYVSSDCPLARAIKRALGFRVHVGANDYCVEGAYDSNYVLPKKVAVWRRTFDRGLPVKPFSFVIKRPKK